jgi:leucyl-tRNA synthetase
MFMGPLEVAKPWSTNGLAGVHRFLDRVYRLGKREMTDASPQPELLRLLHKTIKKVTEDTDTLAFNTAIAQMMIYVNELFKAKEVSLQLWRPLVLLLSPYAPHLAEELWEQLGEAPSISTQEWPEYDPALTIDDQVTIVVQVNGKVRSKLEMDAGLAKEALIEAALANERIQEWTTSKQIVKTIAVPDKLVNIVVK